MICIVFFCVFWFPILLNVGRVNGMCVFGVRDDPGIKMFVGLDRGMNGVGSWRETSNDEGNQKNLAAYDLNSL